MTESSKQTAVEPKRIFEGNDAELVGCVENLNNVYDVIDRLREREKSEGRELTPAEHDKRSYTVAMLNGICASLNTAIEDIDRLSLKDTDGTIFN